MTAYGGDYRALICITTCDRLGMLERCLPHFARFCRDDPRFHLVVALDGTEDSYLRFCESQEVPLVYADEREGVGLSKNRVLERFPEYEFYFFVEDDAELLDGVVFPIHVEMQRASGIHHFSLYNRGGTRGVEDQSEISGQRVLHGRFGGAPFNFFTREGLEAVGGWHPLFARYRRWGHTEHSYRFVRAGLAPAPFNVAEDLADCFIWHAPPAVTRVQDVPMGEDQLSEPERELMDQALTRVELQTLSDHHVNRWSPGHVSPLAGLLDSGDRYPLLTGAERRHARADYQLWLHTTADTFAKRATALVKGALLYPSNPYLRHLIRTRLGW